ncbi:MAG: serine protease [Thermoleophilaceae bacterium]
MQLRRLIVAVAVIACVALGSAAPSFAQPAWAPADSATIRPGNQTYTDGAQCTSNFVFYDASNTVYLGQAAHCSGTGGATETNGCDSGTLPNGTPVEIEDATQPGTMVYNSWIAMQQAGESNADACDFNDFALVRVDPADAGSVNPTIPFWGGPTGTTSSVPDGEKVLSYGNSSLRLGIRELSPKEGLEVATVGNGWSHQVYTVTAGIPGDSGSAFIDRDGRAFGVLSTVQLAPLAGSNGVGDVSREIAYMESHGGPTVTLANGTEPFTGPLLP